VRQALERGERDAAVALCAEHHGAMLGRLCMAMLGVQPEAEDVVQETLIDAHAGLMGWRGEGSVAAWLATIARRKCAWLLERRKRTGPHLQLVQDVAESPASEGGRPDRQTQLRRRAEQARSALGILRPSEREALLLRCTADLSYREIGAALQIDEAAARKRVSRAVAALRSHLQDKGTEQ
jgi:RNA polymerase sigma-70 factor (ECF subfamily)